MRSRRSWAYGARAALGHCVKFPPEEKTTVLREIRIQVGRTGVLTPVAEFDPVTVSGSTIARATLHNIDVDSPQRRARGRHIVVHKAGDVIPEVVGPVLDRRPEGAAEYQMPEVCPACGAPVVHEEGEVAYRCVSIDCPAQLRERLAHWVSRGCMDIDGVGTELIDKLVEAGLVHDVADFYGLTVDVSRRSTRAAPTRPIQAPWHQAGDPIPVGATIAQKVVDELTRSKAQPLSRVLFALGIRHVGKSVAEQLAGRFLALPALIEANEEDIAEVDGIGPKIAASVKEFLAVPENLAVLERLRVAGLTLEENLGGPGRTRRLPRRAGVSAELTRLSRSPG